MTAPTPQPEPCEVAYGSNPDRCHQPKGHDGTHSNRYGTTWADHCDACPFLACPDCRYQSREDER